MYMASKTPSYPNQQPKTPSGRAHEEINKRIHDLNARWNLGLKPRDGIWTPRHGQGTTAEQCVEIIKCLHYSAGTQLDSLLLGEFPALAQQTPSKGRLPLLFGLLTQLLPRGSSPKVRNQESRAKSRIFREGDPELERPSGTTEFNVSPGLVQRTNDLTYRGVRTFSEDLEVKDLHDRGFVVNRIRDTSGRIRISAYRQEQADIAEEQRPRPSGLHRPVQDHTDDHDSEQIVAEYEAEDRGLGLSERAFGAKSKKPEFRQPTTPPASDTEEDDSDVFFSPPGSPTAEAAERKQAQRSPTMPSRTNQKRGSDGENFSPPKRRVSETTTSSSAYYLANPVLKPPALMESFRSTGTRVDSAMTSFAASTPGRSQDTVRQAESANTSFGSDMVGQGPSEEAMSTPWGSSMPSLPPDLDNVITNRRLDETAPFTRPASKPNSVPSEGRLSTHTRDSLSTETRTEMIEVAARSELRAARGSHQPAVASSRNYQEPMSGSSATTETMSTATRDTIYDFTDMVVEQSSRRPAVETSPSRGLREHSAAASSFKSIHQVEEAHSRRAFRGPSPAPIALDDMGADISSPPKRHGSEHWRLSSLPNEDLFVDESNEPSYMAKLSFKARFECARVALACGLSIHDLASEDVVNITKYSDLWAYLKRCAEERSITLPGRSSDRAWDDTPKCEYVNLKARLILNDEDNCRQALFKLHIEPIEFEQPCRFQYVYGGDRFLYLLLPNLKLPKNLKQHQYFLIPRLQEWINGVKNFLGRTWEVVHAEPVKAKSKQQRKERKFSYRLVLFATSGYDILPKLARYPYSDFTKCVEPSSSPEISREELLRWFMPLEKNAYQTYCKAFARLDLGFSKTWRTIHFKPSQVRWVRDIMSDGTPEATEFDDPKCYWKDHQKTMKAVVMNDGCSRISVGASLLIWKKLSLTGSIPSAFQARINGAKGVWIVSGPTQNACPEDLKVWIEISQSQKKFEPHDEDTDDEYDFNRWNFEVLKVTHPVTENTLNVAFIPILEDRGVLHADLVSFVKGIMASQRRELIDCAKNPIELRVWVHKNMVRAGDRIKERLGNIDKNWHGGLPFTRVDRVMYLLEAGFTPQQLPLLGDFVQKIVKQHFSSVVSTYQIPLPRSTLLMGVADPTGMLQPGEIHLFLSQPISDPTSGQSVSLFNNIEVLVARHPSLRNSDIQKVKAVFYPQLAHLTDVVVFSSKGRIPLASKLQGGDYDGDTFWICWEPALAKNFKNAPAPLPGHGPKPEDLGIMVDRRKLGEFLSGPDPVNTYMSEGINFQLRPDVLGWCTNLHKRLAYLKNSLTNRKVEALAEVHDLLIDTRKNGYICGPEEFTRYVTQKTGLENPSLPAQGYEAAVEMGYEHEGRSRDLVVPENLVHILDILHFDLVDPEIRAAFQELEDICKPSHTAGLDSELTEQYRYEMENADDQIREELRILEEAFRKIYNNHWNATMHPKAKGLVTEDRSKGGQDRWAAALQKCYPRYEALQPKNLEHETIKRWMHGVGQGPTKWDLIKASTLYTKFPYVEKTPSKALFAWNMAGRQLMYIKAHGDPAIRPMIPSMLAKSKPKKLTSAPKAEEEDVRSPTMPPSLADKIMNDLTQHEDDYVDRDDDYSSATDFLDRV